MQGNENESLGFMVSAVWVCHPGQIAQILSSLLHCPDFPQECIFPNLMGKYIIYFITEFTVKPIVFLMCGTNVKQNQEAWFVPYLKHCFLCSIAASCLLRGSCLCISILAGKCWSNLPSSLMSNTTTAQEDDMLHTAGIK